MGCRINSIYWITGYDVGDSIATEISNMLIEEKKKKVYCYTFGSFNTKSKTLDCFLEILLFYNKLFFITHTNNCYNFYIK